MKLRIMDNSFRFRVTLEELEKLRSEGNVDCSSAAGDLGQGAVAFRYGLQAAPTAVRSELQLSPFSIRVTLCQSDVESLSQPAQEGIQIRNEWTEPDGTVRRSIILVEKDRPAAKCDKPEEWIYRAGKGGEPEARKIR